MDQSQHEEDVRPREVNQEEYKRGIAQINTPQSSVPSASQTPAKPDALQPVSALGAFPLVRSTQASSLPLLVKGIYRQAAACTVIWGAVTVVFLPTTPALVVVATGALLTTFLFHHSIQKLKTYQEEEEDARFDARSDAIQQSGLPESVEWLNGLIGGIWPRIPAEMFSNVADMLEDTIQANLPSFLSEVKCAELTQGKNPLRVLSSRLLPPTKEDDEEAKWNGGVKKHIQLEVAFAYRARGKRRGMNNPTKENSRSIESNGDLSETASSGKQDARILFLFQAKIGPVAMQLPVKVVLNGLVGIAHIRLELTNESPFLGDMELSFAGLPRVSLDIVPLKLSLAQVPGLSGIIQSSVDSALEMYTMPKKLEMNLGELLMGDGIKRECDACGILLITIHSAHDLERSDIKGKGDAYARVNYTRTSTARTRVTRVIKDELNPRWEQTFSLVVSPQVLAALRSTGTDQSGEEGESVSVEILDSDSTSDDDFLGKATWSLKEIMEEESVGKMNRRQNTLKGLEKNGKGSGTVDWSIGFFEKQPLKGEEEKCQEDEQKEELKHKTKEEIERHKKEVHADLLTKTPPSSEPSLGLLAIQIHGISSLRFKDAESEESFQEAPSSYVEVLLSDRLVFRSRTKMDDAEPCFNAMSEQVCDWRVSSCIFVIRQNTNAGKDGILGVVPIQLSSIFQKASLVTDVYPLAGGRASGRLHLSLLFQSMKIPPSAPRLPASVGLLTVHSLEVQAQRNEVIHRLEGTSASFSTVSAKSHIPSHCVEKVDDLSLDWKMSRSLFMPIYRRDAIALIIKLKTNKSIRGKRTIGIAVMWLNQIEDHKSQKEHGKVHTHELALWDATSNKSNRKYLERNWSSISERDEASVGLKLMGTLNVGLDFSAGVTRFHREASHMAGDSSKVYETWCAMRDAGLTSTSLDDISDGEANGDSSSSSSDETNDSHETKTKRLPLQESGSHGQLFNRLVRRGDEQTTSLKDEIKSKFSRIENRFKTDNDKSKGVETEV